jgi:hypothetical protein
MTGRPPSGGPGLTTRVPGARVPTDRVPGAHVGIPVPGVRTPTPPVAPQGSEARYPFDPVEAAPVRPYAMTGGRTRAAGDPLPIEALVSAIGLPAAGMSVQTVQILQLTGAAYLSVAELAAHAQLPIGVVRVLVGDLVAAGYVRVHTPSERFAPATTLSVLESVLDGISSL